MTLVQLEVFQSIVETGSFTKAGEVLGLTQSAVSHAIAGLESEFGFTLFKRSRSGVLLTDEGQRMSSYVQHILQLTQKIKQEAAAIAGLETGTVRVGVFPSVAARWLPSMMKQFQSNHPAIKIKLFEGGYEEIQNWISSFAVDLGFLSLPAEVAFDTVPLVKDRLVAVLPKQHELAARDQLRVEEIANEPFIMPKAGCDALVKQLFQKNRLKPNVVFEVADNQAIVSLVQAGLGATILPEMTISPGQYQVVVKSLDEQVFREIAIAVTSLETVSPATRAFIETAKQLMKEME
ncbi:LysR family transcriptional regulator [Brevibacillus humidisoli]|uniref:LysR family transcriptional regulator n=1 Tax=Brevibacillus humidisoli TaxID=2895522 RepID=UPI001E5F1B03|nr:LysR family transcriptional regulator [Brevibacillus humidisoli]UFJ39463.1 LysR family transcriptional regulator [Brevibacillus humidisoli]